jgi:hypothetical protein
VSAETPEPSIFATPTQTVAPASSPTTTSSPSPEPTPTETPTPTIDQAAILAQKKQDFINKTGEYSYENIRKELFVEGAREDKIFDLGVVQYGKTPEGMAIAVQGWLFNYREENGNLILEVGFDSKNGDKRIIKDVTVPINFYQQHIDSGIGLGFLDYEFWQLADSAMTSLGMESDPQTIKNYLDDFLDNPLMFLFTSEFNVNNSDIINVLGEKTTSDFGELVNSNSLAVNQLLTEVPDNGEKIGNLEIGSGSLILYGIGACFK